MLTYDDKTFGNQEFKLNLADIYPTLEERRSFKNRFREFAESDHHVPNIFSLVDDTLTYRSEVFISDKTDDRPPLLLLLGNPATHSIVAGMCFASVKGCLEHRFWRLLNHTGLLKFSEQSAISADPVEMNEMRRNALWELKYQSPFRIGIAMFCSLPSAASKNWSGVSGIIKLLGAKAFGIIALQEEKRIATLVSKFIGSTGGIITFQKDAYQGVRSHESPPYDINKARRSELKGKTKFGQHVCLVGAPPTREANWPSSKEAMPQYKNWLSQQIAAKP